MNEIVKKAWENVMHSINAINLNLQLSETKQILLKNQDVLEKSKNIRRTFENLMSEAAIVVKNLDILEKNNAIQPQNRWNDVNVKESTEQLTLGPYEMVEFVNFGGKQLKGKVDTGATTSSLHAKDIAVNTTQGTPATVSFVCPELSPNVITMDLVTMQEVHTADGGPSTRPVVALDIIIKNKRMKNVQFNLNDRSNMDVPVLIGQNILKEGNFIVDVSNEKEIDKKEDENAKVNENTVSSNNETKSPSIEDAIQAAQIIMSYFNTQHSSNQQ